MELPVSFVSYIRRLLGEGEASRLFEALQAEPVVSIRLNRQKAPLSCLSLQPVPWCGSGYYLEQRFPFTFDPLFHAGCYYVQEASSMFLEQALKRYLPDAPVVMLDLCAAPGGKSTHARSLLPEGSLLVANEVVRSRSQVLAENLTKWGHPGAVVTNNDPADFAPLADFFDVILTDVPCSGEGMFRKDPEAVDEWSPAGVELCWQRQRRILTDIWGCLKPGGLLIYSTCTYNTQENEENVDWLCRELGATALPLEVPDAWQVTGNLLAAGTAPVYRFLPHRTRGEGFFLAVLRKPATEEEGAALAAAPFGGTRGSKEKSKNHWSSGKGKAATEISRKQLEPLHNWLLTPENYEWLTDGCRVSAFPKSRLTELSALKASLRVLQAGVEVAELKGKDWLPAHALAMSLALNPAAFNREEISDEQAVSFLRKEAISLPADAPRGIILLTCRQVPLGFVKNVGNRANNLYPPEWRIRSSRPPTVQGLAVSPLSCV